MKNSKFKAMCLPLAFVLAMNTTAPATAANGVGSLSVGSSVLSVCLVVGSTIAFGTYSSTQVDQTGNITVICTFGTSYNVGLDAGSGTGATTAVRKLTGLGGGQLNYALYRNAARTSLWGSSIGTDTLAATATGLLQNITVYGRIAGGQAPAADTYTDTVTVTLTY
ncbi:spore coat U domain-containing protein [Herbaspirillum sp. alder98]|uniref:Csu type fimbrial protein n=1 Tax=Herbaspirillum sp. alder98 TaxID=2913096 RepID=UPI001CD89BB7|nr:spore coat U domain-containing protein [Herbaspirillum sp. alder98]MCA1323856.1 spore coat U domain-containing protein [Herbaspirillum sp. alder98]